MNKSKEVKSFLSKKVSNRLSYTIIAAFAIIFVGFGVYAALSQTVPDPGHSVAQLQVCTGNGEILKSDGSSWTCAADATGSGGSSVWTQSGSDVYYDSGTVSVGSSTALAALTAGGSGFSGGALYAEGSLYGVSANSPSTALRATGSPAIDANGDVDVAGTLSVTGALTTTGSATIGTGMLTNPKVYTALCNDGEKSHGSSDPYSVQQWCGTSQSDLTYANCVPFVRKVTQVEDGDPDSGFMEFACLISNNRLYIEHKTGGEDSETNIGSNSVCGAICGISISTI